MRGEAFLRSECLVADVATVGLLPGVCAQVAGEAALLSERLGADVAAVGLLPRVCAQVLGEVALLSVNAWVHMWDPRGFSLESVRR